jgi:hypothetical protein
MSAVEMFMFVVNVQDSCASAAITATNTSAVAGMQAARGRCIVDCIVSYVPADFDGQTYDHKVYPVEKRNSALQNSGVLSTIVNLCHMSLGRWIDLSFSKLFASTHTPMNNCSGQTTNT